LPRVTVLMPVYNVSAYVSEAVESVLNQTYTDFELIIIDDGSTDDTLQKVNAFHDQRIRVVRHERNIGYVHALNQGIRMAQGEFIARMDGDDICLPERFARQVEYLDRHFDVGVCGANVQLLNTGEVWAYSRDHHELKVRLLFNSCFAHPAVMMRKHILTKHNLYYDIDYQYAEDYELWVRLSDFTHLSNVPEVLLLYRQHEAQVSTRHTDIQTAHADRIRMNQLYRLGIHPSKEEWAVHKSLSIFGYADASSDQLRQWFDKLLRHNEQYRLYDSDTLERMLYGYLY
jgi:glycosyltransferase involved in cell wall biosynthesis